MVAVVRNDKKPNIIIEKINKEKEIDKVVIKQSNKKSDLQYSLIFAVFFFIEFLLSLSIFVTVVLAFIKLENLKQYLICATSISNFLDRECMMLSYRD